MPTIQKRTIANHCMLLRGGIPGFFSSVISRSSQYQSQNGTSHLSLLVSQELHLHTELELLLCLGKFCEKRRSLSFLGSPLYHLLRYQKWFYYLQKVNACNSLHLWCLKPRKVTLSNKRVLWFQEIFKSRNCLSTYIKASRAEFDFTWEPHQD